MPCFARGEQQNSSQIRETTSVLEGVDGRSGLGRIGPTPRTVNDSQPVRILLPCEGSCLREGVALPALPEVCGGSTLSQVPATACDSM